MTTLSTTRPRQLTPAELEQRHAEAFPEALGPAVESESGAMEYGVPSGVTVGPVPHLLPPEVKDRENREREARLAAMTPEQRAAMDTVADLVAAELRRR
jgi:hypothetical protein